LQTSLDAVVESCVNYVGVDLNTASPALLRYVSGLNQLTARRLYDYRAQNGPFRNREQLKDVPGFGESAFVQAAGFLKIGGGDNPLDATWIHPESYPLARQVLDKMECTPADLAEKEAAARIAERAARLELEGLAAQLDAGALLLRDILAQLSRPGRDPREDLPPPIFKKGVIKLDDLAQGMELQGTVLNVVDFGAFVDIGLHDTGLVHISQLANRYVRDPHDVVSVGDIVKVWVHEIDKTRRRVSLTMIAPGTERPQPPRRGEKRKRRDGKRHRAAGQEATPAAEAPPQTGVEAVPVEAAAAPPAPADRRPQPPRSRDRRPPRRQDRPSQGARPKLPSHRPRHERKPQPLVPLTNEMKAGKAPLRTFGDLKQFFELKSQEPEKPTEAGAE
jgi:transcriptional accessory protein Tex/SPT6